MLCPYCEQEDLVLMAGRGGTQFLVCRECDSAWAAGGQVAIETADEVDGLLARHGMQYDDLRAVDPPES